LATAPAPPPEAVLGPTARRAWVVKDVEDAVRIRVAALLAAVRQ